MLQEGQPKKKSRKNTSSSEVLDSSRLEYTLAMLGTDSIREILKHLSLHDIAQFTSTCKQFNKNKRLDILWIPHIVRLIALDNTVPQPITEHETDDKKSYIERINEYISLVRKMKSAAQQPEQPDETPTEIDYYKLFREMLIKVNLIQKEEIEYILTYASASSIWFNRRSNMHEWLTNNLKKSFTAKALDIETLENRNHILNKINARIICSNIRLNQPGLYLRSSGLTRFPEYYVNKMLIEQMEIEENEALRYWEALETIYISENALKYLPESLAICKSLLELYCENNQLKALPESIGLCANLHYFNCSHNQLQSLPESLLSRENLRFLSSEQGRRRGLPGSIKHTLWVDYQNNPNANKVDARYESLPTISASKTPADQVIKMSNKKNNDLEDSSEQIETMIKPNQETSGNLIFSFMSRVWPLSGKRKLEEKDDIEDLNKRTEKKRRPNRSGCFFC